jgi:hypothetical protein
MVPLQNLNIGFLKIEAARQHARDIAITLDVAAVRRPDTRCIPRLRPIAR